MGGARWPQENVVHAITMQVELNVAIREFGIQIVDVLGFAKSFIEEFDAAIFSSLEWAVTIPRCYLPFHLGKVKDLSFEKKKLCVQRIIQSLAPVTGVGMKDAYEFFKNFFAEHDVKVFRLPDWDIAVDLALCNNVTELLSTARTPEAIATTALTLTTPIYDSNPNLPELTVKPKPAKDITSTLEAAATRRFAIKPVTLKDALTSAFKDIFKDVTLPNTVADKVKEASYKTHIKRPRVGAIKDIPMGVQPTYDTPATSMSANDGVKDSFFKHSVYKNDTPFSKFSKAATVMIHDTATRDISTDSRVEDSFFKHDIHRNNTLPSRSSTTDTSTQNTAMSGIFTNDTVEDSFFKHGIHRKNTLPGRPSTTDTPTQNTAMSGIFTNNTAEDSFFKYGIHRNGIPLSKSSMAGTLTSDAFNGDTIMEDSFMGDTRTNDSLIDATFIAQAFMSETRIRKTRSNEVSNGVSNEVPGEVSNEASNEVLDEVSNQRGLDGEYPRGPPERMWTPLKRDMAAATVLLANYGLSVSPPAITHPYTWTDTATSKDLTEEQKAQKNKAQTIASDERRRALAVENFSRLKEARDALKMVDIEFACASLTKLCP
jgi:hypothetical protein